MERPKHEAVECMRTLEIGEHGQAQRIDSGADSECPLRLIISNLIYERLGLPPIVPSSITSLVRFSPSGDAGEGIIVPVSYDRINNRLILVYQNGQG